MKKLITLCIVLLVGLGSISAHVVQVGNVYYDIDGPTLTAEVSFDYYGEYSGDVTVPGKVVIHGYNYTVTEIAGSAFSESPKLKSVTILEGPTRVRAAAFRRCKNLSYVSFPSSITYIDETAFYGTENLKAIYVPRGQKARFASMDGLRDLTDKIVEK